MKRWALIALCLLTSPLLAVGPKYVGPSVSSGTSLTNQQVYSSIYQEFLNIYHDIQNPSIISGAISSATFTNISGSTAAIANLHVTALNGAVYSAPIAGQLPATATNDSAFGGNLGYIVSSATVRSQALGLSTTVAKTIATIFLSPGDWDVRVMAGFLGGAGIIATELRAGISLTANSVTGGDVADVPTSNETTVIQSGASLVAASDVTSLIIPPSQVSLASGTSIYMTVVPTFTGGTLTGFGSIVARRPR